MNQRTNSSLRRERGFTFMELMIVMAIIAILTTIAVPMFLTNIRRARETVLRKDLFVMREAISHYTVDKEKAPGSLDDLVTANYLKAVPVDPITKETNTWIIEMETDTISPDTPPGIKEVKSGGEGVDTAGKPFIEY